MDRNVLTGLLIVTGIVFLPATGLAYENDAVHPNINYAASLQSVNLEPALKKIGYEHGILDMIDGQTIFEWLRYGGEKEDEPITRAFNHFHDPLESWDNAGLALNDSSLVWAQKEQSLLLGGNWSWIRAKDDYYTALVESFNESDRQVHLARAFRALGQVMHLVADASVPAHTRMDIHVYPGTYESWTARNYRALNYTAMPVNPSIFNSAVSDPLAPRPMSALWDIDIYNGTNPALTEADPAVSPPGIAEYSNANFFSIDTINQDYPHPNITDTVETLTEQIEKDGLTDWVWYIRKTESGPRLAAYGYFITFHSNHLTRIEYGLHLDPFVFSDYAQLLVPRAVGYNVALLDYFFRGTLEISEPDQHVYGITDGSSVFQEFTKVKAKVRNTTPNEDMQAGTLRAVARYKVVPDYENDLSNYPPDGSIMNGIAYSYSVSDVVNITSLSATVPQEFAFDFTGDPIPAGITDLSLIVVFKGTLGNEQDIAVAVGSKNLMEPSHHVFWNLSDMFAIDGNLYTEDTIMSTPALANTVDKDKDGVFNETGEGEPYISPYVMNFVISYMGEPLPAGEEVPSASVDNLPAGSHIRLIVLVEEVRDPSTGALLPHFLRFKVSDAISPPLADDKAFSGVYNEQGYAIPAEAESFRHGSGGEGILQHFHRGALSCEPPPSPYCPYPEEQSIDADLVPYSADILY